MSTQVIYFFWKTEEKKYDHEDFIVQHQYLHNTRPKRVGSGHRNGLFTGWIKNV